MFDIEAVVWGWFVDQQESRTGEPIGPSGTGGCFRQQAYEQLRVPQTNEETTLKADAGSLIHMGIGNILDLYGIDTEVLVPVPGLRRPGSADVVKWDEHLLVDIKTYGDRAYQYRLEHGPYAHQWDQSELYGLGLYEMVGDGEVWTLQILGINRDTGEHTVWERVQDLDRARALAAEIERRQTAIDAARERLADPTSSVGAVELAEQFPREGDGPGRGFPCDWCAWVDQCWPLPFDAALAGMSPQSQSVVDDPEQIAEKAAEYRQAADDEREAKDRKYAAQAFLKGITGTFEGWKITQIGGGGDTEVPDVDALIDFVRDHGEPVPMTTKPGRKPYPKVTRGAK